jgi:hypothetical protein
MLLLGQRRCWPVAATDDADVAPKQTSADDYSNMLGQPQWGIVNLLPVDVLIG